MEYIGAIVLFLFVLFLLLGTGVWVGLALMGVAWVGMATFTSRPAGDAMITTIWTASSSWTLTALPLFIWMGEILYRTRLSAELFKGLAPWMAPLPGGLLHTNVAGCTVFAAVSGSSVATLTTVGKMSLPELLARGYPERMVIGSLAGAATLGLLIPPSLILIVYGVSINESITKLFMAGILPGLYRPRCSWPTSRSGRDSTTNGCRRRSHPRASPGSCPVPAISSRWSCSSSW